MNEKFFILYAANIYLYKLIVVQHTEIAQRIYISKWEILSIFSCFEQSAERLRFFQRFFPSEAAAVLCNECNTQSANGPILWSCHSWQVLGTNWEYLGYQPWTSDRKLSQFLACKYQPEVLREFYSIWPELSRILRRIWKLAENDHIYPFLFAEGVISSKLWLGSSYNQRMGKYLHIHLPFRLILVVLSLAKMSFLQLKQHLSRLNRTKEKKHWFLKREFLLTWLMQKKKWLPLPKQLVCPAGSNL